MESPEQIPEQTHRTAEPEAEPAAPDPTPPRKQRRRETGAGEMFRSLLVVLVGVLLFRTFVAEATVIPTGSMEKTILIGDHVFLNKLLYGPRLPYTELRIPPLRTVARGEIVAFRYPRNPSLMYVKRVVAAGGDLVRIKGKRVWLNGTLLEEPYVQMQDQRMMALRDEFPPTLDQLSTFPAVWGLDPSWARELPRFVEDGGLRVPEGHLFVMGDNRDNSQDSRFWGFVPESNVVGEPLFVYWSYDAPSADWTSEDLKDRVKFDLSIVGNFLRRTRWSRTGKTF
jgi:signal peptidase I